jgi:group I intron endonuclease
MRRDEPIDLRLPIGINLDGICCIYLIWCFASQKGYVGSAVNLGRRLLKHRCLLRSGRHDNRHLQSAYNAYTEGNFGVYLLEDCKKEDLLKREQFWIDDYKSSNNCSGYNICPVAGSVSRRPVSDEQRKKISDSVKAAFTENPSPWQIAGKRRVGRKNTQEHIDKVVSACSRPFRLMSPDGHIFEGRNRAEFCREHGLNKSHICMLINGSVDSARGWKRLNQ